MFLMEAWAFSARGNGDVSGLVHKTKIPHINQSGAAGSPGNSDLHLLFLIAL
jgi:hypothetical protein